MIDLSVSKLYDYTQLSMQVKVIRGREDGPRLFVCAAIHGDEVNGIEIIKRLLREKALKKIKGTLIAVPIVNVYGFNNLVRYLPDRRDLNRSFPGSASGPLASRLAHLFVHQIVDNATHGIDLHTGAIHRSNLPQIRACLNDEVTKMMANEFDVPVIIDADVIDGSLRSYAIKKEIPLLVFEGGEALRYDEIAIRSGLSGILSVMRKLEMIPPRKKLKKVKSFVAQSRFWVRAPHSGIFSCRTKLGKVIQENELLGIVSDPMGIDNIEVRSSHKGVIIGQSQLPLVNKGDALFHVAAFDRISRVSESIESFDDKFDYEER